MAAQVPKKYSLFQRTVRVVQTSLRSLNAYMLERMPGLPNPPHLEEELRKPTFIDLWELTFADHRQHFRDAWREYKATFDDADDIDIEKSKKDLREAALRLRGHVAENTTQNAAYIEDKLEGTQVLANMKEIGATASHNLGFLKDEFTKAQAQVDPDAVVENVKSIVDEHRSKKDVVATFTGNVGELMEMAKEGRDAALKLDEQNVEALKEDAQSWFADKLVVAQSVLVAFIDGYKEGKIMEMERDDALLLSYAKQAAQEQSAMIKTQLEQFIAAQKQKQQQEMQQRATAQKAQEASEDQEAKQQHSSDAQRIHDDDVAVGIKMENTMASNEPNATTNDQRK